MKKLLLFAIAFSAFAQVPVAPITQPHVTFVNAAGLPCAGCTLATFIAGTTTPLATYVDAGGVSVNTNPITLDAAGGGNIWLANSAYKLILKTAAGATIWTVDQVKGGGGLGGVCGPAGAVQIANSAVNGLTCDSSITVNTTTHTFSVGTLPSSHVTIGALGTPTTWTFDTTTPATALASLGGGTITAGTANQIAIYPAPGSVVQGANAIPAGITAITQSPSDNSTNPATTAYVASPGIVNPTSVQIASGVAMTANQGIGVKVQHSTGTTTTDNCAKFDANGNTVDAGVSCAAVVTRTCNANGCYRIEGDGTIEQWGVSSGGAGGVYSAGVLITFPFPFTTTANLNVTTSASGCINCSSTVQSGTVTTTGFSAVCSAFIFIGGSGGNLPGGQVSYWHAVGN